MENNQRNSRKRLNSLILLVAFTAVMLIVSTYAWFSTQRNVTLSGITGKVNVAEGLQVSLDGATWVNSINFTDFNQTTWAQNANASQNYFQSTISNATFLNPVGPGAEEADPLISNTVPAEFLPISTTGYDTTIDKVDVNDGIGQEYLKFYNGVLKEGFAKFDKISPVVTEEAPESADSGYFAFDLYVQNTSAEGTFIDKLQLDPNSTVTPTTGGFGTENTARVAFALYNNDGEDMLISGSNAKADSYTEIIGGTSTGKTIKDIAIWEPNADVHAQSIVTTFQGKMTWPSTWDYGTVLSSGTNFDVDDAIPTYALTSKAVDLEYVYDAKGEGTADDLKYAKGTIPDIYNWSDAEIVKNTLRLQLTTQTKNPAISPRSNPIDLISIDETVKAADEVENDLEWVKPAQVEGKPAPAEPDANDKVFDIVANQYQKIRVYIWMEGQDPDCINFASLGGGLNINIGLSKPESGS